MDILRNAGTASSPDSYPTTANERHPPAIWNGTRRIAGLAPRVNMVAVMSCIVLATPHVYTKHRSGMNRAFLGRQGSQAFGEQHDDKHDSACTGQYVRYAPSQTLEIHNKQAANHTTSLQDRARVVGPIHELCQRRKSESQVQVDGREAASHSS